MPQLGETVTEGTITKWLKKIGDKVVIDEILFEVSTDKVDSEVPSTATGYLAQILASEGDTVEVGRVLAQISENPPGQIDPDSAPFAAPAESEMPSQTPTVQPRPEKSETLLKDAPVLGSAESVSQNQLPIAKPVSTSSFDGLVLSPVVRRLLVENSINPKDIIGSGAGGRITRSDVLGYLDQMAMLGDVAPKNTVSTSPSYAAAAQLSAPIAQDAAPVEKASPSVSSAVPTVLEQPRSATPYSSVVPREGDQVIPFNNIRRRTAEHMVRSKATSAHTLVAIEVDFEAVERVRRAVKESFVREEGFSLTYLPFVARAIVEAVRTFPRINSSVGNDELIVHRDLNLAIAVDLDLDGLIAPVIHGADQMRLKGFARKIRDLATRARTKRLSADELAGGTITITNPGPYGTFLTVPIINQPQVAILSTDGVKRKPVVVTSPDGSESIAIHSVGMFAMSFDHRVIDGAYAAAFLARMKEIIETWNWAQEF